MRVSIGQTRGAAAALQGREKGGGVCDPGKPTRDRHVEGRGRAAGPQEGWCRRKVPCGQWGGAGSPGLCCVGRVGGQAGTGREGTELGREEGDGPPPSVVWPEELRGPWAAELTGGGRRLAEGSAGPRGGLELPCSGNSPGPEGNGSDTHVPLQSHPPRGLASPRLPREPFKWLPRQAPSSARPHSALRPGALSHLKKTSTQR